MSNFSQNAKINFDAATNSLKVVDNGNAPVYFPLLPNGVSVEFSNNHLNVNGFGISNPPISTHVFEIGSLFLPYVEWDKVKRDIIVGTKVKNSNSPAIGGADDHLIGEVITTGHKTRNAQLYIGVDRSRGNYGVKISISGQELWVEQGLVSASMIS